MTPMLNGLECREAGNRHIAIVRDRQTIATADVMDDGTAVQVRFNVSHGHLPKQVRHRLVDAAFELPALRGARRLLASIPLGDVDLLNDLRARCARMDTRAAGSTCLVDAVVVAEPGDERPAT
jgi:hypothetical protein